MATQVIIPARYCPFPRWWMLVYCLAGFLLALAGVLLSEPGHAGFLVLMLLILLRAPLQTLANRSETIIDSHARERGCILRAQGADQIREQGSWTSPPTATPGPRL